MAKEEIILRLSILEQEINKFQEQLQLIEQNILELQNLQHSLQELQNTKEKQMLANLGKNIFIKTEILDKNLIVDVGNKIFIKKNIPETIKIIENQLLKLMQAKNQVLGKMQQLQGQAQEIIAEAEKSEAEK
ncbi:MAG TPA: prefoldin subunit alpha [Candidatus Paceibacterota bacterium]|nr:prefoldin subunit alpha [Candidatus Paceibacterota bacterium]